MSCVAAPAAERDGVHDDPLGAETVEQPRDASCTGGSVESTPGGRCERVRPEDARERSADIFGGLLAEGLSDVRPPWHPRYPRDARGDRRGPRLVRELSLSRL